MENARAKEKGQSPGRRARPATNKCIDISSSSTAEGAAAAQRNVLPGGLIFR
jgi:hypothetical protein